MNSFLFVDHDKSTLTVFGASTPDIVFERLNGVYQLLRSNQSKGNWYGYKYLEADNHTHQHWDMLLGSVNHSCTKSAVIDAGLSTFFYDYPFHTPRTLTTRQLKLHLYSTTGRAFGTLGSGADVLVLLDDSMHHCYGFYPVVEGHCSLAVPGGSCLALFATLMSLPISVANNSPSVVLSSLIDSSSSPYHGYFVLAGSTPSAHAEDVATACLPCATIANDSVLLCSADSAQTATIDHTVERRSQSPHLSPRAIWAQSPSPPTFAAPSGGDACPFQLDHQAASLQSRPQWLTTTPLSNVPPPPDVPSDVSPHTSTPNRFEQRNRKAPFRKSSFQLNPVFNKSTRPNTVSSSPQNPSHTQDNCFVLSLKRLGFVGLPTRIPAVTDTNLWHYSYSLGISFILMCNGHPVSIYRSRRDDPFYVVYCTSNLDHVLRIEAVSFSCGILMCRSLVQCPKHLIQLATLQFTPKQWTALSNLTGDVRKAKAAAFLAQNKARGTVIPQRPQNRTPPQVRPQRQRQQRQPRPVEVVVQTRPPRVLPEKVIARRAARKAATASKEPTDFDYIDVGTYIIRKPKAGDTGTYLKPVIADTELHAPELYKNSFAASGIEGARFRHHLINYTATQFGATQFGAEDFVQGVEARPCCSISDSTQLLQQVMNGDAIMPKRFFAPYLSLVRKVVSNQVFSLTSLPADNIIIVVTPVERANLGSVIFCRPSNGTGTIQLVGYCAPDVDLNRLGSQTAVLYTNTSVMMPTTVGGTSVVVATVTAEAAVCGVNPVSVKPGKLASVTPTRHSSLGILGHEKVTISSFTGLKPEKHVLRDNTLDPLNAGLMFGVGTMDTSDYVHRDVSAGMRSSFVNDVARCNGVNGFNIPTQPYTLPTTDTVIWSSTAFGCDLGAQKLLYGDFTLLASIPLNISGTTPGVLYTLQVTYFQPFATVTATRTFALTNGVGSAIAPFVMFSSLGDGASGFGPYRGLMIKSFELLMRSTNVGPIILGADVTQSNQIHLTLHDISVNDTYGAIVLSGANSAMQITVEASAHVEVQVNPQLADSQFVMGTADAIAGDGIAQALRVMQATVTSVDSVAHKGAYEASKFSRAMSKLGGFLGKAGKSAYKFAKDNPELVEQALSKIETAMAASFGEGPKALGSETGFQFAAVEQSGESVIQMKVYSGSSDTVWPWAPNFTYDKSINVTGSSSGLAFALARAGDFGFLFNHGTYSGEIMGARFSRGMFQLIVAPVDFALYKIAAINNLVILTTEGWFRHGVKCEVHDVFNSRYQLNAEPMDATRIDERFPNGSTVWDLTFVK